MNTSAHPSDSDTVVPPTAEAGTSGLGAGASADNSALVEVVRMAVQLEIQAAVNWHFKPAAP